MPWSATIFTVMRRTDRLLSILPLAHSYEFTIGFLIPIMHGSAVYYLDRPPSATALLPALAAIKPTIMLSVPLVIEKIFRSGIKPALGRIFLYKFKALRPAFDWMAGLKLKKTFGGKLRFFGIGGAPIAADVETFLHNAHFLYSIGYGLTEAAPLLTGNKPGKVRLHTTGIPATGVSLRIADARPDTGEGEIQARGPNIFPGYYKDPIRTAESFSSRRLVPHRRPRRDECIRTHHGAGQAQDHDPRRLGREHIPRRDRGSPQCFALCPRVPRIRRRERAHRSRAAQARGTRKLRRACPGRDRERRSGGGDFAAAIGIAAQQAEASIESVEKRAGEILDRIKKETNCRLAAFSRLARVELQAVPFEKTPKQSIKRFLYPMKERH